MKASAGRCFVVWSDGRISKTNGFQQECPLGVDPVPQFRGAQSSGDAALESQPSYPPRSNICGGR